MPTPAPQSLTALLFTAIKASLAAAEEILAVYDSDFAVEHKADTSPLTLADKRAHEVIRDWLKPTGFPFLSEEGEKLPTTIRQQWTHYWLVDPLDGTKEFVKRNGEFTVNIAFIEKNTPVLGVIYVPVKGLLYFGHKTLGAYKALMQPDLCPDMEVLLMQSKRLPLSSDSNSFAVVASRSHLSRETQDFIEGLKEKHPDLSLVSVGSSLKFCLVAEGTANLYPRFSPTCEWDTAAGHAIVTAAGKTVIDQTTDLEMKYNKDKLINNWFVVQ